MKIVLCRQLIKLGKVMGLVMKSVLERFCNNHITQIDNDRQRATLLGEMKIFLNIFQSPTQSIKTFH